VLYDPLVLVGNVQPYLPSISSSAMTPLKPTRMTSFFADKPSTIAEKRKPPVIMIHADAGPGPDFSVAGDAATEKGGRNVDVVFVIGGEGLLVSFHVVTNATGDAT
jgi:hypothetical protein